MFFILQQSTLQHHLLETLQWNPSPYSSCLYWVSSYYHRTWCSWNACLLAANRSRGMEKNIREVWNTIQGGIVSRKSLDNADEFLCSQHLKAVNQVCSHNNINSFKMLDRILRWCYLMISWDENYTEKYNVNQKDFKTCRLVRISKMVQKEHIE